MENNIPLVEIYSKDNCELCTKLKKIVEKVKLDIAFELKEIDITLDEKLFEKYKYDIPVVHINGIIAFKHRIDELEFRKKLFSRKVFRL